jgi:hypothetical protein
VCRDLAPITDVIRHTQFRIGVDSYPSPNVTPARVLLIRGRIFLLRSDKRLNLITLETPYFEAAHVSVVEGCTRISNVSQ